MAYLVAGIIGFGVFQFFWSIRYAYRLERYKLAAGYPIFGHVLHTLCVIAILASLAPRDWHLPVGFRLIVILGCISLTVIHGWLLYKFTKWGEKARLEADRGK